MIRLILVVIAVVAASSLFGWRYHENQLDKQAVQKASLTSCQLANQALQQKNEAEQKATNGRFNGPPLQNCS